MIDPSHGVHKYKDIALSEGKVVAVEKGLNDAQAKRVIDASGEIVTLGLVDLHAHVYDAVMPLGVEADASCLSKVMVLAESVGRIGLELQALLGMMHIMMIYIVSISSV